MGKLSFSPASGFWALFLFSTTLENEEHRWTVVMNQSLLLKPPKSCFIKLHDVVPWTFGALHPLTAESRKLD